MTAVAGALVALAMLAHACRDDDPRPPDVYWDYDRRGRFPDVPEAAASVDASEAAREATAMDAAEAGGDAGADVPAHDGDDGAADVGADVAQDAADLDASGD
jgi:hypothetical protein